MYCTSMKGSLMATTLMPFWRQALRTSRPIRPKLRWHTGWQRDWECHSICFLAGQTFSLFPPIMTFIILPNCRCFITLLPKSLKSQSNGSDHHRCVQFTLICSPLDQQKKITFEYYFLKNVQIKIPLNMYWQLNTKITSNASFMCMAIIIFGNSCYTC